MAVHSGSNIATDFVSTSPRPSTHGLQSALDVSTAIINHLSISAALLMHAARPTLSQTSKCTSARANNAHALLYDIASGTEHVHHAGRAVVTRTPSCSILQRSPTAICRLHCNGPVCRLAYQCLPFMKSSARVFGNSALYRKRRLFCSALV